MGITQFGIPDVTGQTLGADFDVKGQNEAVSKWASMVQRKLRNRTSVFMHGKEGTINRPGRIERNLNDSIKSLTKKSYGVIDRVTYTFERHGVFVHKGVGRGYKMEGGMVIRTAKSEDPKPRLPNEWFNPLLDQTLPELADKLAEINADALLNATRMMIK